MPKPKPGLTRVCCDCPIELHDAIKEYNKNTNRPINMNATMIKALKDELEKAKHS